MDEKFESGSEIKEKFEFEFSEKRNSSETKEGFWANLKDKDFRKETIRPRALEVLTALSFFGGVTLTALIASGVLLWGPIGLGICATFGFIGASHLFGTMSWREEYYENNNGTPCFKGAGEGWNFFTSIMKFLVLPIIFALGGISLIVLGSLGIMGLGLGLGLGIPSIVASLFVFNFWFGDYNKEGFMRGVWLACIAVAGMIAAVTFLVLGFAGILAWSSVLAFGVPAAVAAVVIPIVGIAIGSTDWIKFRTRVEELLEPVLLCGGIALTVLISLGILPFGAVGIGICSALIFISASRFLTTNSWSNYHSYYLKLEAGQGNSLIAGTGFDDIVPVKLVSSILVILVGIVLPVLGVTGVFGLGLGLAVGIPILGAGISGLVSIKMYKHDNDKYAIDRSDNVWSVCTMISGAAVTGVSLGLGFGGILTLPVAIAIAAPLAIFSALIAIIHGSMFWLSKQNPGSCEWLKSVFTNEDKLDDPVVGICGIGRYKLKKGGGIEIKPNVENRDENNEETTK